MSCTICRASNSHKLDCPNRGTDVNGNPIIRDVSSHGVRGILGAPEGSYIGGPGVRSVQVTPARFPDLDPVYVEERDKLSRQKRQAELARAARK